MKMTKHKRRNLLKLKSKIALQLSLIHILNSQGMEARGFPLPSLFWQAVGEQMPALVLLDIMLPEEDGLSVLKKLRATPRTAKLPVIMLTAKGTEYDLSLIHISSTSSTS